MDEDVDVNENTVNILDHDLLCLILDVNNVHWLNASNSSMSLEKVLESVIVFLNAYIMTDRNSLLAAISNSKDNW